MSNILIVTSMPATEASDQPNTSENVCSHTTPLTDAQVRLANAAARREYDLTERTSPRTIEHIRQLIALECGRVDREVAS